MDAQAVYTFLSSTLSRRKEEALPAFGGSARLREDLGMDSLEMLEVAFDLETEFGIRIGDRDMHGIRCVDDVVTLVVGKLAQGA